MQVKPILIKMLASQFLLLATSCTMAQTAAQDITRTNAPALALAPLKFLASDELMGRSTTRLEINIAARYVSEEFRSIGIKELPGTRDYFQTFAINLFIPSQTGTFTVNNKHYNMGEDVIHIYGTDVSLQAPVVYAGIGLEADLEKIDVKGKIVITEWGASKASASMGGFDLIATKTQAAMKKGAVALVERCPSAIWQDISQYFMQEHQQQDGMEAFNVFLVNDKDSSLPALKQGETATLSSSGNRQKNIAARNVMGWVEGTDAKLKDQFIVLSAHYDHLGVAETPKIEEGKTDSIYNGARDNAIGTTAVIDAERYFAGHPSRRSMLFIAYTGEEMGLLGSRYFAAHPALPLKQLVYNLNIDNASYNDTTLITFVGLGRTTADADIKKTCAAYGLSVGPDPHEAAMAV